MLFLALKLVENIRFRLFTNEAYILPCIHEINANYCGKKVKVR